MARGGIKTKTTTLAAGAPTVIKARLKPAVRNHLLDQLEANGKAKVTIKGTFPDATGATDTTKAKAKLKG